MNGAGEESDERWDNASEDGEDNDGEVFLDIDSDDDGFMGGKVSDSMAMRDMQRV